jgi:hypothetical protein
VGSAGAFGEDVVKAVAGNTPYPEEVATRTLPEDLEGLLEAEMWRPEFLPLRRAPGP